MPITARFDEPFYTGGASASDFSTKWDVALNGRPYLLDLKSGRFRHVSVPLLRQQADQGASPSESSINPNDLWRRSQDSWHKGAGQSFLDRGESDAERFHTSKGIDVWTRWQLQLLPATTQKRSSANSNLNLVVAGSYVYLTDGTELRRTADMSTWTNITGVPAGAPTSIASDGYNVWTSHTADGIFGTTRGAATTAAYTTGNVTLVGYVKGRLLAAYQNILYNVITSGGALPAALYTHPNTDFAWVGFAEGATCIYAAGFSGDKSLIYRTAIKADGTALDIPVVAGELPDGEIVRSIQGYLGFLLIGTDKGVRFAAADGSGNLTMGSLIPTGAAVRCFEPQDRFCWYGLTNYDTVSTGLGRLDLSTLTASLTPAYASDLMMTGQGNVLACATFLGLRVFTVAALGVYAQDTIPVASGTLETGQITYRLPDDKVAMFVDVRHDGVGSHAVSLSTNGGSFTLLGTHTTSTDPFPAGQRFGTRFELRLLLTAVANVSPVISAITLRSYPAAPTIEMIEAPLLLAEAFKLHDGTDAISDPSESLAIVKGLRDSRELVTWQEGDTSIPVVIEDFEWRPTHATKKRNGWNGTLVVQMKAVS